MSTVYGFRAPGVGSERAPSGTKQILPKSAWLGYSLAVHVGELVRVSVVGLHCCWGGVSGARTIRACH